MGRNCAESGISLRVAARNERGMAQWERPVLQASKRIRGDLETLFAQSRPRISVQVYDVGLFFLFFHRLFGVG
jgi:hypothetical protein